MSQTHRIAAAGRNLGTIMSRFGQAGWRRAALGGVVCLAAAGWCQAEEARKSTSVAGLTPVDVFVSGQDGYNTYRIPGIEVAADGTLLAFAEARRLNSSDPGMEHNDIDLVLKRSTDGGKTWSPMVVIEDPGEYWSAANPATVLDRDTGKLWLLYLRCRPDRSTDNARPGTDDHQIIARFTTDAGQHWSEPIDLTTASRDMQNPKWRSTVIGPGGMIQDRHGRLIAPAWMVDPFTVFAIYSEDHGKTWQRGAMVPGGLHGDENQLVELADGTILMDFRQGDNVPHRWFAASHDGGKTWDKPHAGLPVSQVACGIERLLSKSAGDDHDCIVWTGPRGPGRNNLVVRISHDNTRSFPTEKMIAENPAAYSDLARMPDKSVAILYERDNYGYITFLHLTESFLHGKP